MKIFFQERSLFFKYLVSYIIILFIPIFAMTIFVNYQFMGVLQEQLISENSNTLRRVMYVIDSYIKQIQTVKTHIQVNRSLYPYYELKDPTLAMDAQRELGKYLASNNFIKEIVVYFRNDRFLYSSTSSYTVPLFINKAYQYSSWSEENFRKDINTLKFPTVRPSEQVTQFNNQPVRLVTFIYPVASVGFEPTTTVLFLVEEKFFTEIMKNNFESHDVRTMIFDQQDQIITASENMDSFPVDDLKKYLSSNVKHYSEIIHLKNQKFLLSVQKSGETGWKYVSLTPIQELAEKTAGIQTSFSLVTFVLLLVGSIIIYYSMQTNYKPLQNLKNYAENLFIEHDKPSNEIEFVKNTINYLSDQNKRLISETRIASKDFILESLLKGRIKTYDDLKAQGEPYGISFKKNHYMVIVVLLLTPNSGNSQAVSELMDNFENVAALFFDCYAKDYLEQNKIVLILSLDAVQPDILRERINAFQKRLKETMNVQTTMGAGKIYEDVKDIPLSYIEASSALDYRLVKGNNRVIFIDELSRQEDSLDSYPHKELEALKYLIKKGNASEVEYTLNNILNYIKTCNVPLFIARGICYDIVNTVWKSFTEINKEMLLSKIDYPNASEMAEFETIDELTDLVKKSCIKLSSFIKEYNATQEQSFVSEIVSYIQNNFTDYNFSIQNMADHFGMTLTNLSQYFKNQTGQTIIDYTTNLRIEKAKELLISTHLTLNEISMQVGYLNVSSFIRRFKQLTGLTPGQFEKEYKKRQ